MNAIAVADVVVGGAGYNTVYECAALGVPLVAIA
nr:glycosyltransferase [Hassalia byssoidea]